MDEETKLAYMGISKKDLENSSDFVIDYDRLMTALDNVTNEELLETVEILKQTLEENEKGRYEDYKEQVDEFENFNVNDYINNEGLINEYMRGKIWIYMSQSQK